MKTLVALVVSIMLSILFCPIVIAYGPPDPIPAGVQISQPDPSLPKELSGFLGKWEGSGKSPDGSRIWRFFLIVEKINEKEVRFCYWQSGGSPLVAPGWVRHKESKLVKEAGKYKILFRGMYSRMELTLKGEDLDWSALGGCSNCYPPRMRLTRATKW